MKWIVRELEYKLKAEKKLLRKYKMLGSKEFINASQSCVDDLIKAISVLNGDTEKRVVISCSTCKYVLPKGRCKHPQGCEGDYELWEQEIT